jgi:hypothetical protein
MYVRIQCHKPSRRPDSAANFNLTPRKQNDRIFTVSVELAVLVFANSDKFMPLIRTPLVSTAPDVQVR